MGKCVEYKDDSLSTSYNDQGWSSDGLRQVFYQPYEGELCMVTEDAEVKRDGTTVSHFKLTTKNSIIGYVSGDIEVEECSTYQDIVENSPMVKFISMLVAVVVALLVLCGCILCCSYCRLETRYTALSHTVQ